MTGLINWKKYKKLTKEQKEEYNFKYNEINYPRINLVYLFSFYLIWTIYILIMYLILIDDKEIWKMSFSKIFILQMQLTITFLFVWIFDYIGQTTYHIYKKWRLKKWLKKIKAY